MGFIEFPRLLFIIIVGDAVLFNAFIAVISIFNHHRSWLDSIKYAVGTIAIFDGHCFEAVYLGVVICFVAHAFHVDPIELISVRKSMI